MFDALREIIDRSDEREAAERGITIDALRAERAEQRAEWEREQAEHHAEERRTAEVERERATVRVGALAYIPGEAIRLSQLSARSWGAGVDRRAVVHALVVGSYGRGRLSRADGQFLCSTSLRPWDVSERFDADVTCPVCLHHIENAARG